MMIKLRPRMGGTCAVSLELVLDLKALIVEVSIGKVSDFTPETVSDGQPIKIGALCKSIGDIEIGFARLRLIVG